MAIFWYVGNVLITPEAIQRRVSMLGAEIARDYADKSPVLVCALNGALMFMADLMREIDLPIEICAITASSYEGAKSAGSVDIIKPLNTDIAGRDVILVEDIVDTGITLASLMAYLRAENPASIEVCALLDKKARREVEAQVKYVGFEIPDEFVVGYGLDYNQKYRNLPYIATLNPDEF